MAKIEIEVNDARLLGEFWSGVGVDREVVLDWIEGLAPLARAVTLIAFDAAEAERAAREMLSLAR